MLHFQFACQCFELFNISVTFQLYAYSLVTILRTELDQCLTYSHSSKTTRLHRILSFFRQVSDLMFTSIMPLYPFKGILSPLDGAYTLDTTFRSRGFMSANSIFHSKIHSAFDHVISIYFIFSLTCYVHDQYLLIAFNLVFQLFFSIYIHAQLCFVQLTYIC